MNKTLNNLKRRLEKLELEHLRSVVLALHTELEKVEGRLEAAISEAGKASDAAEFWHEETMRMMQEVMDMGGEVRLTKSGEILVKLEKEEVAK